MDDLGPLPPSPAEVGDLLLSTREHVTALGWGNREHLYPAFQVRTYTAQEVAMARARWRGLIEQCRAALEEELSAWDIEPPLHHVKAAHDACCEWLSGQPTTTAKGE